MSAVTRVWSALHIALIASLLIGCGGSQTDPTPSPAPCGADLDPTPAAPPYKVVAPALRGLWVLDLTGESTSRQLLARTLQGVVNRLGARLYIVDDVDDPKSSADSFEATRHWLSAYQASQGLKASGGGRLEDALQAFAGDVDGYLLASEAEPWNINAACTEAARRKAVVATDAEVALLQGLGLQQLDTFVGRWTSAVDCFTDLAAEVGQLSYPGFSLMRPIKLRSRDFMVQQGIAELGGLPGTPEWQVVRAALKQVPSRTAIYGYAAEDALQELNMVRDISHAGDVLVPSDSCPNVSFHMAVRPAKLSRPSLPADLSVDCEAAELNVVVGLSDGDNLVVETALYPTSRYWLAPERGRIPIAWSMSPALATFAPAVLDYYLRTVAPTDELVVMIGAGYAYGSQMPDADWFYALTFTQMNELGLRVLWLFDPLESGSGNYSWQTRAQQAADCGRLAGVLDGYYPPLLFPNAPSSERVGSVPLLRALGVYDDHPPQIADKIRALLAKPRAQRPRVVFYSAAAWNNDVPGLMAALLPLEQEGVRFVSASAGLRCVERTLPDN